MKTRRLLHLVLVLVLVLCAALPRAASAQHRLVVRAAAAAVALGPTDPLAAVTSACARLGCAVQYGLDGDLGRLFLVTAPATADPRALLAALPAIPGIERAELDIPVGVLSAGASGTPPALMDNEPLPFFGANVRGGYLRQPAVDLLRTAHAWEQYGLTGGGTIVAIIDTGIDPNHPALRSVVIAGFDYTRNRAGGSELSDVNQSTMTAVDNARAARVNQSTVAVVDQSTMEAVDGNDTSAFGHGTMVAGIVHLVAPGAKILPLKAFRSDGRGYSSDVLRAIYTAVREGADILNMSFSYPTPSKELEQAIDHATSRGVVAVASVGNEGQRLTLYPAGMPNVIGVASATDADALSSFSNFGSDAAWVAAPGEGVVTTYPHATYAAAWGTSFSAPFAAGLAALLREMDGRLDADAAADAEGHAIWISPDVSRGRIDVPSAIRAWRARLGLP